MAPTNVKSHKCFKEDIQQEPRKCSNPFPRRGRGLGTRLSLHRPSTDGLICETWLSDFVYDHEILPSNYSIYRKDRLSRGGGVLIAVN